MFIIKLLEKILMVACIGLIFTACVSGTDIRTSGIIPKDESSPVAQIESEVSALQVDEVTEERIPEPAVFIHPLLGTFVQSLETGYGQWAPGEDFLTDRFLKVIFDMPVDEPELILVNEKNQEVKCIKGYSYVNEEPESWVFEAQGLMPGESYIYSIRDGEAFSEIREMTMPDEDGNFEFLVFGDLQGYKVSQYNLYGEILGKADLALAPDAVYFLGDVVDVGNESQQWQYFMDATKDLSWQKAMASPVGNHDVKGGRDWYNRIFSHNSEIYEDDSVAVGYTVFPNALIAMIDTEKTGQFEEQMTWLGDVMASHDVSYKILLMHRSPYPIFYEEPHIQKLAEGFEAMGIDLVLSGHDHIYSRTQMDDIYYVVGGSGSGSKYYSQSETRPWQGVVYDDNNPVHLRMSISDEALVLKAYAYVEGDFKEVDAFRISP